MTAQYLCNSIQEVHTPQIKKPDDIKVRKNSAVNIQKKGHQNYLVAFFYSSLARKGIFNVVLPWLHFFRKKVRARYVVVVPPHAMYNGAKVFLKSKLDI